MGIDPENPEGGAGGFSSSSFNKWF